MGLKRYIANCSDYTIYLVLEDGREVKLRFDGKDVLTKKRFIDVSDPLIQKELDKSKDLGVYFSLSDEFGWMKEGDVLSAEAVVIPARVENVATKTKVVNAEPEIVPVKKTEKAALVEEIPVVEKVSELEVKPFKNIADAKVWINKTHQVPYSKLKTKESVEAEYKKLNFDLQITIIKK